VAQHLEKRRQDVKKNPPTPLVGENIPVPGTLAHTLLKDINTSNTKDLMNKLFYPVKGPEQGMQDDHTLDFLAGQLHLPPDLLKKDVRYFIDNMRDDESYTRPTCQAQAVVPVPPQEYVSTPKASHTRK
jgi:hypothetical protein